MDGQDAGEALPESSANGSKDATVVIRAHDYRNVLASCLRTTILEVP